MLAISSTDLRCRGRGMSGECPNLLSGRFRVATRSDWSCPQVGAQILEPGVASERHDSLAAMGSVQEL